MSAASHRPDSIRFTKMNGAGNDFVVLDNRGYGFSDDELSFLAKRLCPRRTGIGADGLLALNSADESDHDYRMRYFNADGSPATMCGNGARCLARFALAMGVGWGELLVDSDAGTYRVDEGESGRMQLQMEVPKEPVEVDPEARSETGLDSDHPLYQVWAGTEHVVIFVDEVDSVPVEPWGRALRNDPLFAPEGTNVNFVEVEEPTDGGVRIRVRTYEKGVEAETLACGTGAIASAWATFRLRASEARRVAVEVGGGTLGVHWDGPNPDHVVLEGDAEIVYEGRVEIDWPAF